MRTFENWLQEAEGFQGKMTPGHNARRGAIEVQNKLNLPSKKKGGALATTSQRAGKKALDVAGSIVKSKMNDRENARRDGRQRVNSGPGVNMDARRQRYSDRARAQKAHDDKAGERLNDRRGGVMGGVKSALGGDVIGVRPKKGETEADVKLRKQTNRKNRADFAKKKVQQVGSTIANQASSTQQNKGEKMQDAKVTSAKRGVYNP